MKKKKSGLNANIQRHQKIEGWCFIDASASSTVQQNPRRDRAQSMFQSTHFPASCKISPPVFKYFTTTVLGAAVTTEVLFKVTFLPLENRNPYNRYLTKEVPPATTTSRQMETLAMLRRNTLKQRYKHRQSWECVLQQNCHLMAVHSIYLCAEQSISGYFPLKHNMELLY